MTTRRRRLLLVTPHPVWPPTHGWAVRLWNLVRRLADRVDVYPLIFSGGTDDEAQRRALQPYCAEVYFQEFSPAPDARPDLPPPARRLVWEELRERIRALLSAHRIDLLQLEGTEFVGLLPALPGVPVIVTAHDLGFETHLRRWQARLGRYGTESHATLGFRECLRLARYELAGLAHADQVHCMSEANARLLAVLSPRLRSRLRVVPNGVDCAAMAPPAGAAALRRDVLLLGSFPHPPNADAVEYFLAAIWPRVRRAVPEARVTLAGASPPAWVQALDGREGVVVAGEVDDVRPLLWRHAVLAVPLRAGSGTRIKILEAMGAGLPVVSTPVGAAGLGAHAGRELELARRPADFAARLARHLLAPAAGERQAERARRFVAERFDWDLVAGRAIAALDELVPPAGPARPEEPGTNPTAPPAGIEILVPWQPGSTLAPGFLEVMAGQDYHLPFRLWFVARFDPPPELRDECARRGFAWRRVEPAGPTVGALLDAAIEASRAELFAILEPRDLPRSDRWLGHVLWALQQPSPPAAVLGEILAPGAAPAEREALAARGGLEFRFSNLALRRAVWSALPFGARIGADRAWPRAIEAAHLFVLASPDAPVDRTTSPSVVPAATSPDAEVRASVVVCTRERGAVLAETLRAVAGQSAPFAWELLVVDNGSRDGSLELARELARELGPRARVVEERVAGLSAARNAGVRTARGELILFLDDDAQPYPGWLEALARALDEPGVLAAGGPIEPVFAGPRPAWLEDRYLPYLSAWNRGAEAHDLRYNELPRGTNMAFRREAFARCGEFSRHLGRRGRSLRSCEETEFGLRLERAGARVRYVPAAGVWHRVETQRLSEDWLVARFAAQGESEAIVDWMHWGWAGLKQGLAAARQRALAATRESGSGADLGRRCHQASLDAYRKASWWAPWMVPRHRLVANTGPDQES